MKKILWGLVGLAWLGCGAASDPGYEVIYRPSSTSNTSASEERQDLPRANISSIEAPRRIVDAMQGCADRLAPKLPGESFAVLFDVNVGANGNTVKVKDSMLDGSPLEHCLATALERMDTSVSVFQPNVSPQSRGMVGIAQTAAGPITLLPIALVAFGTTILVGVTIYVIAESLTEKERCRKVKAECLVHCSIDTLHQGRSEPDFTRCMRACLEPENCW